MKVAVWGINYSPELVGIAVYNTDLCEYLSTSGHQVEMVAGFPYYPEWRKRDQDKGRLYSTERVRGVAVHRCWLYVPSRPTSFRRIVHEATFVLTSSLRALMLPAPDVYIVVSPPMLLGMAAAMVSVIKRKPFIYHVQDLQPDAALRLGMLKPGKLTSLLFAIQRFTFGRAARISSISKRMCDILESHGASASKIIYFPNWFDDDKAKLPPAPGAWKQRFGIEEFRRIVSYAGNFGAKQGLETVIEAAAKLQQTRPEVLFVLAGDGADGDHVRDLSAERKLNNILFQGVLPPGDHASLIIDSELCLIPQKPGSAVAFLPSKLLKILALGRPVVINSDRDSALHDALLEGRFGLAAAPGDAGDLARAILKLLDDVELRRECGECGKRYIGQFGRQAVLSRFELDVEGAVTNPATHAQRIK